MRVSSLLAILLAFSSASSAQKLHQQPSAWGVQADLIRDAVESHYATVVDDVLSIHAEECLLKLTHSSRCQRQRLLQSQAEALSPRTSCHDACTVARLPQYIGQHIHLQKRSLADAVTSAVDETLQSVWPEYRLIGALPAAQHQVASMLYSVNLAIEHRLQQELDAFDLLERVRHDIETCQTSSEQRVAVAAATGRCTTRIFGLCLSNVDCMLGDLFAWANRQADTQQHDDGRFLEIYERNIRADLRTELESRVGELVVTIYDDLYAEDDDEEF